MSKPMSHGRYVELEDRCPWCTREDTLDDYRIGEAYEWTEDSHCEYGRYEFPVGIPYIEFIGCHTCTNRWNDVYNKDTQEVIGYKKLTPSEYKVSMMWVK